MLMQQIKKKLRIFREAKLKVFDFLPKSRQTMIKNAVLILLGFSCKWALGLTSDSVILGSKYLFCRMATVRLGSVTQGVRFWLGRFGSCNGSVPIFSGSVFGLVGSVP